MEATSPSTSSSLVRHVQRGDAGAWERFSSLYVPLVYHWVRGAGLQESDARDVCQNVFLSVVQNVTGFRQDASSSFRGWLRTITGNAVIDWQRRQQRQVPPLAGDHPLWDDLAEPASRSAATGEAPLVAQQAAETVRRELAGSTWAMFEAFALERRPAEQVAAEHGVSVWAVYKARSRVLARLRELLGDYLPDL